MNTIFEPNIHPLIVHFPIAFLFAAPFFFLASALRKNSAFMSVGNWLLGLGVISALLAIAAGLQAYYTIAHDGPSHAAMTDHRNWAMGTTALFLILGLWRLKNRQVIPTGLFAAILFIPAVLLGVTGWKGGHLVYQYGLGVQSLPVVSGEGHDHEHTNAHGDNSQGHDGEGHDGHTAGRSDDTTAHESKAKEKPAETQADEHDHSTHEH